MDVPLSRQHTACSATRETWRPENRTRATRANVGRTSANVAAACTCA